MSKVASLFLFDLREAFSSMQWIVLSWVYFTFQLLVYGQLISRLVVGLDNYLFYYGSGLLLMIVFNSASWAGRSFVEGAHEGRLKYLLSLPISRGRLFLERVLLGVVVNLFQISPPLIFVLWTGGLLTPTVFLASIGTVVLVGLGVVGLMISLSFIAFKSFDMYSAIVAGLSALLIRFSTIFYPLVFMPRAYASVSLVNPLTYGADLLRFMLQFDPSLLLDAKLAATIVVALMVSMMFIGIMLVAKVVEGVKSV